MASSKRRQESDELGMLIGRSRRLVYTRGASLLESRNESMLVWQVLNRLRREGALTQCELARQTAQHPAGISRLLSSLERDGQVRRTRDRTDKRKVKAELTGQGLKRLASIDPVVAEAAEGVFSPLSQQERRTLRALLRKLLDLG